MRWMFDSVVARDSPFNGDIMAALYHPSHNSHQRWICLRRHHVEHSYSLIVYRKIYISIPLSYVHVCIYMCWTGIHQSPRTYISAFDKRLQVRRYVRSLVCQIFRFLYNSTTLPIMSYSICRVHLDRWWIADTSNDIRNFQISILANYIKH